MQAAGVSMVFVLAVTAAAQNVLVVDAANGPGTNFVDLPAAVAAAASGDRIDVRAGHYAPFHASGKALRITGAGAALTIVDGAPNGAANADYVTIDGVPAGAVFRMEGLAIRPNLSGGQPGFFFPPASVSPTVKARLSIGASAGSVVLSDLDVGPAAIPPASNADGRGLRVVGATVHCDRCSFKGGGFSGVSLFAYAGGGEGALVEGGGALVANDSAFIGGSVSAFFPQSTFTAYGGTGLTVKDANARLFGGAVQGGSAVAQGSPSTQAQAGHGVIVVGASSLRIAGAATATGGTGAAGLWPVDLGEAYLCYAPAATSVHAPVVSATNGGAIFGGSGAVTLAQTRLPSLACVGTPRPEGALDAAQTATILIAEPNLPGALFALFLSGGPGFSKPYPTLMANELLLADIDFPVFVGTTDAAGDFAFAFTAASAFPAALDVPLHLQAAVIDAAQNLALMSDATVRVFR
jgi:hypothetical protein